MISLLPIDELTPIISRGDLVAFNVGFDGTIYLVLALNPLDYRFEQGGASFAKTVPDQAQVYRVIGFKEGIVLDRLITNEPFNIHKIQPLPADEFLLVCARCYRRSETDIEKNGRVYSLDGEFKREFVLGDGIREVQTTSDGTIWTSFSDEGVFGNYGWNQPLGESGLVAWDSTGNKKYEFQPTEHLKFLKDPDISECYALNVASDLDTWLYYYTDFPLVHLHQQQIRAAWKMPIQGSGGFAVFGDRALFQGGYDDRDTYYVFSLPHDRKAKLIKKFQFSDETGQKLIAKRIVGRGSSLYLLSHGSVYQADMLAIGEVWQ